MDDDAFRESVAGQIEGLAQSVLVLGATLQQRGVLDTQFWQANLRIRAEQLPAGRYGLADTQRLMIRLADELLHVFHNGQRHVQTAGQFGPRLGDSPGTSQPQPVIHWRSGVA